MKASDLSLALLFLIHPCAMAPAGEPLEVKFAEEVAALERAGADPPPPVGSILFIGSSSFRLWKTLSEDMAPLPVLNRGFGGSRTWEILHYTDRLVLPASPRVIAYYCGANDVDAGETPEAIAGRFIEFAFQIHVELPGTPILFVSVIRAPQKLPRLAAVDETNRLVREHCDKSPLLEFVDANSALCDEGGEPRIELFDDDRLHLSPDGYARLTEVLRPHVECAWLESGGAVPPVAPPPDRNRGAPDPPINRGKAMPASARARSS